jgi:hypothetical protein
MALTVNTRKTAVFANAAHGFGMWLKLCVFSCLCVWQSSSFAQDNAFTGQWQGVWHIGMSSGKVMLTLTHNAPGVIAFTNMPGFGNGDTVLQKTTVDSQSLMLSVQSERGTTLTARLQLKPSGHTLEGMGQYAGASVKLELLKSD